MKKEINSIHYSSTTNDTSSTSESSTETTLSFSASEHLSQKVNNPDRLVDTSKGRLHTPQRQQLVENLGRKYGNQQLQRLLEGSKNPTPATTSSNVLQRQILRSGTKPPAKYGDAKIRDSAMYKNMNVLHKKIVDFWLTSPSVDKSIDSLKRLGELVTEEAKDPAPEIIKLMTYDELSFLLDSPNIKKNLTKFKLIKERLKALASEEAKKTNKSGAILHNPLPYLASGVSLSASDKTNPASMKGRDDGKFPSVLNDTPGALTATTNAPNRDLIKEQVNFGNYQKSGNAYKQICSGCVVLKMTDTFEVDHQEAFSDIRDKLQKLAFQMQESPALKKKIEAQLTTSIYKDFFMHDSKINEVQKLYPTVAAVKAYSNDTSNLMRICRTCNGAAGKSDMDFLEWYSKNELYGELFLAEYLPDDKKQYILGRAKGNIGWGQAARQWFNDKHWPTLQKLFIVDSAAEQVNQGIREENSLRYEEAQIVRPALQGQEETLQTKIEQQRRHNELHVGLFQEIGASASTHKSLIAKDSPARVVKEVKQTLINDEKKREKRELAATHKIHYKLGNEDARSGKAKNTKGYNNAQVNAYEVGYDEGITMGKNDYLTGYKEGVIKSDGPTSDFRGFPSYMKGYNDGEKRRKETRDRGFEHGKKDKNVEHGVAKDDPCCFELINIYIESYNEGRSQRTKA